MGNEIKLDITIAADEVAVAEGAELVGAASVWSRTTDRRTVATPSTARPPQDAPLRPGVFVPRRGSVATVRRSASCPCHHRGRCPTTPSAGPPAQPDRCRARCHRDRGGIVGVSALPSLRPRAGVSSSSNGLQVAAGASGRNSGVVQHPFDPVLVELHLETLRLYRALDERPGAGESIALPAEFVGLLMVTHDWSVARRVADELATHAGLSPTFLGPDEVRALEPAVGPGVSACRVAIGYPVGPAAATRAWAAEDPPRRRDRPARRLVRGWRPARWPGSSSSRATASRRSTSSWRRAMDPR